MALCLFFSSCADVFDSLSSAAGDTGVNVESVHTIPLSNTLPGSQLQKLHTGTINHYRQKQFAYIITENTLSFGAHFFTLLLRVDSANSAFLDGSFSNRMMSGCCCYL